MVITRATMEVRIDMMERRLEAIKRLLRGRSRDNTRGMFRCHHRRERTEEND